MKALELIGPSKFEVVEKPAPKPNANEVVIRVKACGICGSDIHGMDGSSGRRIAPIVMGHEASGVIEAVGAEVSNLSVGDRVTFDSTVFCNQCDYCNHGRFNLCDDRQVMGVSCEEFHRDGAFADMVVCPEHICHRLPEGLSFEEAAFAEPVGVALHAVNRSGASSTETAVVIGSGLIGLLIIQALRTIGCSEIIAIDLDDSRLELAIELGATMGVNSQDSDAVERAVKRLDGKADHCFEVVGATPTVNLAIGLAKKGGSVTLVGNLAPEVQLPLQKVVTGELTLYGSCAINGEYPDALDAIVSGDISVKPLITASVSIDEAADWFAKLKVAEKPYLKVLVCPESTAS